MSASPDPGDVEVGQGHGSLPAVSGDRAGGQTASGVLQGVDGVIEATLPSAVGFVVGLGGHRAAQFLQVGGNGTGPACLPRRRCGRPV